MRNVRGAKALSEYLESVGAPMSESTIFNLLRQGKIPHQRPSPRILIFNLDAIDEWLGIGGETE
ncbi:helix-turn-helix transcriptional regulator [Virgibacillus kimchii]